MVNALGGVDLDSRYEFTTIDGAYYFTEGMNYDVDGDAALAFARERYNLPSGDNDRVVNQQIVLEAIINKCISPAILMGYMGIMDSLSDSFETSLSQSQISSLVRMQLSDGASWEIMSSSVWGYNSSNYCYSSGDSLLYVMEPDYDSVATVADFITRMKNGEVLSEAEVNAAMEH
jgi:anionic cell wall polymer biosynthesis LytR-Cps2A-Psr (LCP) family protein